LKHLTIPEVRQIKIQTWSYNAFPYNLRDQWLGYNIFCFFRFFWVSVCVCVCVCVCVHATQVYECIPCVCRSTQMSCQIRGGALAPPGTKVMGSCKKPRQCWELSTASLQVLLSAEPPHQPPQCFCSS
jgi:hypothetical protein